MFLILHIASLTSIADYLVIGSGESERQARAIADHVSDILTAQGHAPLSMRCVVSQVGRHGLW